MRPLTALIPDCATTFDTALAGLFDNLLTTARLSSELLALSMEGLLGQDLSLSNTAIAGADDIGLLECEVNRFGTEIIAHFRPHSTNLRQVLAAIRITNSLQGAAEQGVNIAKRTRKLTAPPDPEICQMLGTLFRQASNLIETSVTAFKSGNDDVLTLSLRERDKNIDHSSRRILDRLVAQMPARPEPTTNQLILLAILRHLERLADHAMHIAEDVIYAADSPAR